MIGINMRDNAEKMVSKFYNEVGWNLKNGITEDAIRFEDLRDCAADYVSKCRMRVFDYIPSNGQNILDMASGPIQYPEYLTYSKNFSKRYCVDLSDDALEQARKKILDHGVYINDSFFNIDFEDNFFDCSISLHTIYHIQAEKQEEAVRKLLRITKADGPVIIVYSNRNTFLSILKWPLRKLRELKNYLHDRIAVKQDVEFYFHPHNFSWWNRFSDVAEIEIVPWRSFNSKDQKLLFPSNGFGRSMFNILYKLENKYPYFFSRYFQYPMIILRKK
jgi:ubiquinone/menaquinone biosynthesis C-methylase UbiE